jgi:beta-xylosidase
MSNMQSPTGETNSLGGMSGSSSINDMGNPIEMGMTAEELEIARQEWQAELNQIDEEIQTLRQVLTAKTRRSHELKRKLGVTVWNEFTSDMNQGIKNVRESTAYQKTESAIKGTAEKATSLLGGLGSAVSQKIGALKNTDSFRSMEERVSSAVSTVKTKMGGSRSGSVQSFDDALREATANQGDRPNGTPTPVATPVNEDKPLS